MPDSCLLFTCRYKGRQVNDLLIPGGIYIIVNNCGAFPKIKDVHGRLYHINTDDYELVDQRGNILDKDIANSFYVALTNNLTMLK